MKEEKKSFKEKWQDKRYQAKVKLSGYGIFILIIIIMLAFGQNDSVIDSDINNDIEKDSIVTFNKPSVNNYTYMIEIITSKDDKEEIYSYSGKVLDTYEELVKKIAEEEYNYKIIDNKYYILNNGNYVLTTKEEVYDILDYNYLNIDNINNYLSYSKKIGSEYQVYLKDIVLDSAIDEYITFSLEESKLTVDYTSLVNNLYNEEYNSYIVNIEYTE